MTLEARIQALATAIGIDIKALYGRSGAVITTIEKDLGYPAKYSGSFLITGLSGLTLNKQVVVQQACGPYTGKGDNSDESEVDVIQAVGFVLDGSTIKVHYNSSSLVGGNFKFNYLIQ